MFCHAVKLKACPAGSRLAVKLIYSIAFRLA